MPKNTQSPKKSNGSNLSKNPFSWAKSKINGSIWDTSKPSNMNNTLSQPDKPKYRIKRLSTTILDISPPLPKPKSIPSTSNNSTTQKSWWDTANRDQKVGFCTGICTAIGGGIGYVASSIPTFGIGAGTMGGLGIGNMIGNSMCNIFIKSAVLQQQCKRHGF